MYGLFFANEFVMQLPPPKTLYLPALSIVAVVLMLLVFIGFSTYQNLDRARSHALRFVHREGVALLQAIEAGTRAWMMTPMWQGDSLERLIVETGRSQDIAYIYLIDPAGRVIHHSGASIASANLDWRPNFSGADRMASRFRRLPNTTPVYELAKPFEPVPAGMKGMASHHARMMRRHFTESHLHEDAVLVIGLKMTTFEEARQEDLHHAFVMAAILAALAAGALFFIFVIHSYHRMNRTLKQTRDYTHQVVDSMANGLLSIDAEGRVLTFNHLSLALLGSDRDALEGIHLGSVFDFQLTGIAETLTRCRSFLDREVLHRTPAGEDIPLALSVTPISDASGNCDGAVVILRDLREIKRLEERVRRTEKLAAIGKMSAAVAHEIRNPLSSIRGFAQFLGHALKDRPKEGEYAAIMVKEVDRINRVVTDLLTFARPMETVPIPAKADELIDHTLRLVEADAEARQVHLEKQVFPELGTVYLDSGQMTQVLLNLILNALQEVGPEDTVTVGAAPEGGGKALRIWVTDEGPGIAPDHMERIFDPFFTTREKGTGLGLAIVQKIVENHQGRIQVESPVPDRDRGSRFTIRIPQERLQKGDHEPEHSDRG